MTEKLRAPFDVEAVPAAFTARIENMQLPTAKFDEAWTVYAPLVFEEVVVPTTVFVTKLIS